MQHLRVDRRALAGLPGFRGPKSKKNALIGLFAVAAMLTTVTPALAASQASLSLRSYGDIVWVTGSGFPAKKSTNVVATFNDLKGQGSITTNSKGALTTGFRLPSGVSGTLNVKATSGSTTASASKTIGNAPAPTTTTTAKPAATTTTAKPATTTSTAAPSTTTTKAPQAPTTTSTTAAQTTTTTAVPAPSNVTPLGVGGAWNLKFNDEFNGTAIDRSKFPECHYATRPGCVGQNEGELQAYRPGNVTVSGGAAHLTAKKENVNVPELGKTLNYTSGSIATGPWNGKSSTYKFTYGYVEARVKMAPGAGVWSSLWMEQANMVWPPEIDIFEAPNFSPSTVYNNVHYGTSTNHGQQNGAFPSNVDYTAGFHTFGLEWSATSLKWYMDGKLVRTFSDANKIPKSDMYLIANLSVGGWAKTPPASTKFPSTMDIDYIRIFQK